MIPFIIGTCFALTPLVCLVLAILENRRWKKGRAKEAGEWTEACTRIRKSRINPNSNQPTP